MNMGTFEAMDQMEMMEVNGGARSRSARRAAQRAARQYTTTREIKTTIGGMSSYAGVLIGLASVCACTAAAAPVAATWVGLGLSGAGFVCSY